MNAKWESLLLGKPVAQGMGLAVVAWVALAGF